MVINGGPGNDTLPGTAANDVISGLGGDDKLTDTTGNDKLDGGDGNDTLDGGADNDTLLGGAGNDGLIGGDGKNVLNGGSGDDTILGSLAADTVIGGDGNDSYETGVGADIVSLGKGDDLYGIVDPTAKFTELANQGHDTVYALINYKLGANFEDLVLLAAVNGTGNELKNTITGSIDANKLEGAGGDDVLFGDNGNDTLVGGAGNDTMNGGNGQDTLNGGAGNDTYFILDPNDTVSDGGGGIDTIITDQDGIDLASASLTDIEQIMLLGTADLDASGNTLANKLSGNSGKNALAGGAGNDTLDGGGGNDTLKGGAGNDTYLVDNAGDQVLEDPGQGTDTVIATANYTLGAGQSIELLTMKGASLEGKGNELANTIVADGLFGHLYGLGGDDTLKGGTHSILDGGTGNDVLIGGKGNDRYVVDSVADKIVEGANQSLDLVQSTAANYTLSANIEDLDLLAGGLNATGNTLANTISGNTADNVLSGGGGNDQLWGYEGADTILGGAGADELDGWTGIDVMKGGAGNDNYYVYETSDVVSEVGGSGIDKVYAAASFVLGTGLENLELIDSANVNGTGNAVANAMLGNIGNNELIGNAGNDTLNGGAGDDTLKGGVGNDTYFVDSVLDQVVEKAGEGKDTVISVISHNMALEIETLILRSSVGVIGTGNTLANTITMDGVGSATLIGGDGNDILTGNINHDHLLGNDGNDKLTGGAGNDTLDGGAGNDIMVGGTGWDRYIVSSTGDKVTEGADKAFSFDVVESHIANYTLGANLESLELGTGAVNGTGNALNNHIVGNDQDNKLDGAGGHDRLLGGGGKDLLLGQAGQDQLYGGEGADTLKGGAGNDQINGGFGDDVLYGEAGVDRFEIGTLDPNDLLLHGNDTIIGFQVGVDKIDPAELCAAFGASDLNAFSDGFLLLTKSGADTLVQFDKDGSAGGASAITVATVVGVTVTQADFDFGAV